MSDRRTCTARLESRRWFRFGLRTLFMLVTILGVWLGVQVKWIRGRHEAIAHHKLLNGEIVRYAKWPVHSNLIFIRPAEVAKAPWSIRILGETGINTIFVNEEKQDMTLT